MKTKILALILAIACLSVVFFGCAKEKTCDTHVDNNANAKCDVCDTDLCSEHKDENEDKICDDCSVSLTLCEHKDDNSDKFCDTCGGAIVVLYEQVAPVTGDRVPTVVHPIPTGVDLKKYINTAQTQPNLVTALTNMTFDRFLHSVGNYWLVSIYNEATTSTTYRIYDVENGKIVCERNDATTLSNQRIFIDIELSQHYYTVTTEIVNYLRYNETVVNLKDEANNFYDYTETVSKTTSVYTYSDSTAICSAVWTPASLEPWEMMAANLIVEMESLNNVDYINFNGTVWAFDAWDSTVLGKFDPMELIYRPAFDVQNDKFGYIEMDGKIFVYDLTKWIECVYSYEIPMNYQSYFWFVLENGNVLLQSEMTLPRNAISYDFTMEDEKFDLVYTVLDPVAKTAKNVEFGYYIYDLSAANDITYTAEAKNIAYVAPLVNDVISSQRKYFILNNDLTVAADITDFVDYQQVSDNVYLKYEDIGTSSYAIYLVDVNGTRLSYLPYAADIKNNYVLYDSTAYNFKMEKLMDLTPYSLLWEAPEYMIFSLFNEATATTEYYYYNGTTAAPVKLTEHPAPFDEFSYEFGYMTATTDLVTGVTTTSFYNVNNQKINCGTQMPSIVTVYENVVVFMMTDGTYVIAK